jgi:thioredoxin-like negative regulator of GroEL
MTNRKNTLNAWDRVMAAISFAEAGDQETAMEVMNQGPTKRTQKRIDATLNTWDRVMAAIAFAEAGEQDTATEVMNQGPTKRTQKRSDTRVERREGRRPEQRM